MRFIAPIKHLSEVTAKELKSCMEANLHAALDVKYAIFDSIMWTVFIHPLKELSEEEIQGAISQVFISAFTYGTLYTSTNLSFPAGKNEEEKPEEPAEKEESY